MDRKLRIFFMLSMLLLGTTSVFAAGVNPLEYMRNAFFELATNYVLLIIIVIIMVAAIVAGAKNGEWSIIWWGVGAAVGIALVPTLAPGVMEWARIMAVLSMAAI